MKTNPLASMLIGSLLASCGAARRAPTPALFPISLTWKVPLTDTVEGPLATDGERIFVAARDGTVRALAPLTGDTLWEKKGRTGALGYGEGLLVLREADGTVWGMDPATGSTRWKVESGITGTLPPIINKEAVLVAGQGLAALRPGSGETSWSLKEPRATAAPVAAGRWILVGEADGTLRGRDATTGASLWTIPTAEAVRATPVVDDRQVALLGTTDRRFLALDLAKGKDRWTWRLGADVESAAALLEDLVLFSSLEDVLYALRRSNGHLVWRAPLPSRPLSGPLLYGSAVLVACHGSRPGETFLLGFDGHTGRRQGDLKAPGEIATPPLLAGDRVYVGLRGAPGAVAALALGAAPPASPPPANP